MALPSVAPVIATVAIIGAGAMLLLSGGEKKGATPLGRATKNDNHPSGLPLGNGYDILPEGNSTLFRYVVPGPFGVPMYSYPGIAGQALVQKTWSAEMAKRFQARNAALGFSFQGSDRFAKAPLSREKLPFPHCYIAGKDSLNEREQCGTILVDEFGRVWPGKYGEGSSDVLSGLNTVLKVASPALLLVPGWGPAAYLAVQVYLSQGQKASLKDAAIAVARSQVPGGPAGQVAFDFGVGVVIEGQSPREAGINAAYNQLSPEQKAAFEHGRQAAKDAGYGELA